MSNSNLNMFVFKIYFIFFTDMERITFFLELCSMFVVDGVVWSSDGLSSLLSGWERPWPHSNATAERVRPEGNLPPHTS